MSVLMIGLKTTLYWPTHARLKSAPKKASFGVKRCVNTSKPKNKNATIDFQKQKVFILIYLKNNNTHDN